MYRARRSRLEQRTGFVSRKNSQLESLANKAISLPANKNGKVGVRLRAVIVLVYVMLRMFHRRKNITMQHDSEIHEKLRKSRLCR